MERVAIYMPDKIGHIPCGNVTVLAEIGYKWVFVRPATFPNCQRKKLRRAEWDKIVESTEAMRTRGLNATPATKVSR